MFDRAKKAYNFPDENARPEKKRKKEWGLQAFKAAYSNSQIYSPNLFFNRREDYYTYKQYAFGRQDSSQYYPTVNINPNESNEVFATNLDFKIKNYATKRINVTVSKMSARRFTPTLNPLDPISYDKKLNFKSQLQFYSDHQQWIQQKEQMLQVKLGPEVQNPDMFPNNTEEIEVYMNENYKDEAAKDAELGLRHHSKRNDLDEENKMTRYDLAILGAACMWPEMDYNLMPKFFRVDPGKIISPYAKRPDFNSIKYIGYIDTVDIPTFKQMHRGELKDSESNIIEEYAKKDYETETKYDYADSSEVKKIPIMRMRYYTTEERVWVEKKDRMGNTIFKEKPSDYYREEGGEEKFKQKFPDRKIHRKTFGVIYEGYWVVNSPYLFRWGPMKHQPRNPRNIFETNLGVAIYAPNMYDGKVSPLMEQMIPTIDELQELHLKAKQLLAQSIPQAISIDLYALRNADLKLNGKQMTDQQLFELFLQRGVLFLNTMGKWKGNNSRPFEVHNIGIAQDFERIMNTIQAKLIELDDIIGTNKVSTGSNVSAEMGKAVAETQLEATDHALSFLYEADKKIQEKLYQNLLLLHIQSVKYNPKVYESILGKNSVQFITNPDFDLSKRNFGIHLELEPTQVEWGEFYQDVQKAIESGQITIADKTRLMEFESIKQARQHLRVMTEKNIKRQQQSQLAVTEQNHKQQLESNAQAHQQRMKEKELEIQEVQIKSNEERKTKRLDARLRRENDLIINTAKAEHQTEHIEEQGEQDRKTKRLEDQLEENNQTE